MSQTGGGGGGWMPGLALGSTLTQIGKAAKDIQSTLESSLHNVAENIEGAFVTLGEGSTDKSGCVSRTSSYSSDSGGHRRHSDTTNQFSGPSFEGSERERLFEGGAQSGSGGSGSMGCGSSYDSRVHEQNQTSPSSAAINCDMCGTRFSFISRKRSCQDCGNVFCTTCLPRDRARQCERCGVLNKGPPHRGELMKLRVKDLQHFLTRKRINIKSCVEKKDLVELVLQHSQVSSPSDTSNSTHDDAGIRVSDQVPLERNRSFPQNYVESSHRHQWFQDKFGDEDQDDEDKEDVSETPVEPMSDVNNDDSTPVEPIPSNNDSDAEEDEVMSVVIGDSDSVAEDDQQDDDDVVEGAVGGEVESGHGKEDVTIEEEVPKTAPAAKRSFDHLNCDSNPGGAASLPNSPRRFANHGLVYLSEIQTEDDLNELSTKQIKDLLAMNRVNFKGCVEKEELLKILKRLWQ